MHGPLVAQPLQRASIPSRANHHGSKASTQHHDQVEVTSGIGINLKRVRAKSKGDDGTIAATISSRKKSLEQLELNSNSHGISVAQSVCSHPSTSQRIFVCQGNSVIEVGGSSGTVYRKFKLPRSRIQSSSVNEYFVKVEVLRVHHSEHHIIAVTAGGTIVAWMYETGQLLCRTPLKKGKISRGSITSGTLSSSSNSQVHPEDHAGWNIAVTNGMRDGRLPRYLFYCQPGSTYLGIFVLHNNNQCSIHEEEDVVADNSNDDDSADTETKSSNGQIPSKYFPATVDLKLEKKGFTKRHGSPLTLVVHRWATNEIGIGTREGLHLLAYNPNSPVSKKGYELRCFIGAYNVSQVVFHKSRPVVILVHGSQQVPISSNGNSTEAQQPLDHCIVSAYMLKLDTSDTCHKYEFATCFSAQFENAFVSVSLHNYWPLLGILSSSTSAQATLGLWELYQGSKDSSLVASLPVLAPIGVYQRPPTNHRPSLLYSGDSAGNVVCVNSSFNGESVLIAYTGQFLAASPSISFSRLAKVPVRHILRLFRTGLVQPVTTCALLQDPGTFSWCQIVEQNGRSSISEISTDTVCTKPLLVLDDVFQNQMKGCNGSNVTEIKELFNANSSTRTFALLITNVVKSVEEDTAHPGNWCPYSLVLVQSNANDLSELNSKPNNAIVLHRSCTDMVFVTCELVAVITANQTGGRQVSVLSLPLVFEENSSPVPTEKSGAVKYTGHVPPQFTINRIFSTPYRHGTTASSSSSEAPRVLMYVLFHRESMRELLCFSSNLDSHSPAFDFSPRLSGSQAMGMFASQETESSQSPAMETSLSVFALEPEEYLIDIKWQQFHGETISVWPADDDSASQKLAVLTNCRVIVFEKGSTLSAGKVNRLMGINTPGAGSVGGVVSMLWQEEVLLLLDSEFQLYYWDFSSMVTDCNMISAGTLDGSSGCCEGSMAKLMCMGMDKLFAAFVLGPVPRVSLKSSNRSIATQYPSVVVRFRPLFLDQVNTKSVQLRRVLITNPQTDEISSIVPGLTNARLHFALDEQLTSDAEFVSFCHSIKEMMRFTNWTELFATGISFQLIVRLLLRSHKLMLRPIDVSIHQLLGQFTGYDPTSSQFKQAQVGSIVLNVKQHFQSYIEGIGKLNVLLQRIWDTRDLVSNLGPLLCMKNKVPSIGVFVEEALRSLSTCASSEPLDVDTLLVLDVLLKLSQKDQDDQVVDTKRIGALELIPDNPKPQKCSTMFVASSSMLDEAQVQLKKLLDISFVSGLANRPATSSSGETFIISTNSDLNEINQWIGIARVEQYHDTHDGDMDDEDVAGFQDGKFSRNKNCIASQADMKSSFDEEDALAGYWRFDEVSVNNDLTRWGNCAKWSAESCHIDHAAGECQALDRGNGTQVPFGRALVIDRNGSECMLVPFSMDSVMEAGSDVVGASDSFTVEAWVRLEANGGRGSIFGKRIPGNATLTTTAQNAITGSWNFAVDTLCKSLEFTIVQGKTVKHFKSQSGVVPCDGREWAHISVGFAAKEENQHRLLVHVNGNIVDVDEQHIMQEISVQGSEGYVERELVVGESLHGSMFMELRFWLTLRETRECQNCMSTPLDIAESKRKFMIVISGDKDGEQTSDSAKVDGSDIALPSPGGTPSGVSQASVSPPTVVEEAKLQAPRTSALEKRRWARQRANTSGSG